MHRGSAAEPRARRSSPSRRRPPRRRQVSRSPSTPRSLHFFDARVGRAAFGSGAAAAIAAVGVSCAGRGRRRRADAPRPPTGASSPPLARRRVEGADRLAADLLRDAGPVRERRSGQRPWRARRQRARSRATTRPTPASSTAATTRAAATARAATGSRGSSDLGFTAVWVTPPFRQQTVQGGSAAYHGYWGVDFTTVDPHLGTDADFGAFVECAHRLGLKVDPRRRRPTTRRT